MIFKTSFHQFCFGKFNLPGLNEEEYALGYKIDKNVDFKHKTTYIRMSYSSRTNTKHYNKNRQSYTQNNQSHQKTSQSHHQNLQSESSQSSSISYRQKQYDHSKSNSLKKLIQLKNKQQLCVQCLSNRSSSREKILENKIQFMLKLQQEKMMEFGCNGSKIKFSCPVSDKNVCKKQSSYKKKQPTFLSDFLGQDVSNKQNSYHPNRQSKFHPNDTAKSNKLTLRHYIDYTPQNNSRFRQDRQQQIVPLKIVQDLTQRQDWLDQKQQKNPSKQQNNDKVLKQVRQLKGIFMELLHSRQQIKTRRKTTNFVKEWSQQSKQAFTLP